MNAVPRVQVVGHTRRPEFEWALNAAYDAAERYFCVPSDSIEVQYAGKQHGYYSAIIIVRGV